MLRRFVLLITFFAASLGLLAAEAPKPKKYNHIVYLTGGVTEEESKAIRALGGDYGLQLFFAAQGKPTGAGEIKVIIKDLSGETIIDGVADGPLFFVKVVGGRYTVILDRGGDVKEKTFDLIGRRFGQFAFDWADAKN
ncbi:MAG: hypothetical protein ABIP64_12705 [Burkholderiales bacterium]